MINCPKCMASIRDDVVLPYNCSCGARITDLSQFFVCPHLGEPTGETVACKTCGEGAKGLPVFSCAKYGNTVQSKPVQAPGRSPWNGMVCLICIAKGMNG